MTPPAPAPRGAAPAAHGEGRPDGPPREAVRRQGRRGEAAWNGPAWEGPAWDELVASALLGTERRTPPVPVAPGRDAPTALLDAAALSTVRRRA
ncbi:hypothetical protein RKE29_28875, partial [Streptomyces sp. B1866]|uniref:DUF5691 domain-containing protein n=1 Tax=Streptomyces sp. B1866 TaxID=3075431 RepID=UPI00288DCFB8